MIDYWKGWRKLNICWDSMIGAEEETVGRIKEREQKSVNDDQSPQNVEVKKDIGSMKQARVKQKEAIEALVMSFRNPLTKQHYICFNL